MYDVCISCQLSKSERLKMDAAPPELPPQKMAKLDNGDSYIPTGVDGGPDTSLLFSLREEKGALIKALKPFEVRREM